MYSQLSLMCTDFEKKMSKKMKSEFRIYLFMDWPDSMMTWGVKNLILFKK